MIIDVTADGVSLLEADHLRRFHVAVPAAMSDTAVDSLLRASAAGHLETTGQAAIDVDWLRAGATDVGSDWHSRFQDMLAFAASKGWITADGGAVRGHLVRQ